MRFLVRLSGIILASYLLMPSFVEARNYDPQTGRFLQRDPESPGQVHVRRNKVEVVKPNPPPTNPLDANPYTYVRNSPVNFTDPYGTQPVPGCPTCGFPELSVPPIPPGLISFPTPSTGQKGKECSTPQLVEASEDGQKEVVCNRIDRGPTVCVYNCKGKIVTIPSPVPGDENSCPPSIIYKLP